MKTVHQAQHELIGLLLRREIELAAALRPFATIQLDAATVAALGDGFANRVRDARAALGPSDRSEAEVNELCRVAGIARA